MSLKLEDSFQDGNEAELPYEWEEEEEETRENRPASSSCTCPSNRGTPLSSRYPKIESLLPYSRQMSIDGTQSAHSSCAFEEEKASDSLEDRFPFLKEERKRTRKLLTAEQTRVLESVLEKTIYPSTALREAVARQLGISPRKVQIWFQNKRQGRRRSPSERETSMASQVTSHKKLRSSEHRRSHTSDKPARVNHIQRQPVTDIPSRHLTNSPYSIQLYDSPSMHARVHSDSHNSPPLTRPFYPYEMDREENLSAPPSHTPICGKCCDTDSPLQRSPHHILPLPKCNDRVTRSSWSVTNSLRDRPSPLAFDERSRKSSDDSIASSASSYYRGDDWCTRYTSLSSSSSSRTAFSENSIKTESDRGLDSALSIHMLSSSSSSSYQYSSSPFAKAQDEKVQLTPINLALATTAKKNGNLPSIAELIL